MCTAGKEAQRPNILSHETHNTYHDTGYQDIIKQLKNELLQQREMLGDTDKDNPEILEIIAKHWNE